MALPPIIQAALDTTQAMQQYSAGAISDEDMARFMLNQQQSLTQPQFDLRVSDMNATDQAAVQAIAQRVGIQAPAGVINNQLVDAQGNVINSPISVERYGELLGGVVGGKYTPEQILPGGQNIAMMPTAATGTEVAGNNTRVSNAPPTGLVGAEQALTGGLAGAQAAALTGAGTARADIAGAQQQALQQLQQGRNQAGQLAFDVNQMAGEQLAPYSQAGQAALQQQAALSGALGSSAQAQAFRDFQESPGQQFLREQAELGTTRNAAALGGLGGGRVQQELQRQAMGLAQQDFANQFNRLGQVAGQGLQAGSQQAGITGALGGQLLGENAASQRLGAQLTGQAGQALGGIAQQTGQNLAAQTLGTGQQIGANRLLTGQQLAQNIGGTSTALANLANQYGMSISDLLGVAGGNLSNLLAGTGAQVAQGQQSLGTTLGNIAVGQGSQAVGLPGIPGVQQQQSQLPGVLGGIGGLATGAASLLA